jgi:hypothetical protein
MGFAFHRRHFAAGAHHRFWLIVGAMIAFFLAALWTAPIG